MHLAAGMKPVDERFVPYLTAWLVVACIVGVGITAFVAWVVS